MATAHTNLSLYDKGELPSGKSMRITLVVAEWNNNITENLYQGAFDTLIDCGVNPSNINRIDVPGSFELVYGAKSALQKGVDGVIVIGSVIQGQTKHFDYVCQGVTQGIISLNLTYDKPVIFCVLTDDNMQQALDRSGGIHGNKGVEAAVAAIKMIHLSKT